jgi:hypothetical protein
MNAGIPFNVIETVKRQEIETIPLRRRGTPEDITSQIVALASPAASWISGQVISVDGGLSLHSSPFVSTEKLREPRTNVWPMGYAPQIAGPGPILDLLLV